MNYRSAYSIAARRSARYTTVKSVNTIVAYGMAMMSASKMTFTSSQNRSHECLQLVAETERNQEISVSEQYVLSGACYSGVILKHVYRMWQRSTGNEKKNRKIPDL
jgi:hypothetical protein